MRIRLRVPTTPPTVHGRLFTNRERRNAVHEPSVRGRRADYDEPGRHRLHQGRQRLRHVDRGTGATIPKWITPANGYTFVDLTAFSGYQQLSLLALRNIIPNESFKCTGQRFPIAPRWICPSAACSAITRLIVDYPTAASLPKKTSPLTVPSACGLFPTGDPGDLPKCGVLTAPVPYISSVVTECAAPGCTQFTAQENPPITVIGQGFGVFPDGTPYRVT